MSVGLFRDLPLPQPARLPGTPHDVAAEVQRARNLIRHLTVLKVGADERYVLVSINWALQALALRTSEPQARTDREILEALAVHAERRARDLLALPTESAGLRRDLPLIIRHIETARAMLRSWDEA